MKRVLVTGACGFVGRWVVQKLVRDGYAVCAFDINPTQDSLNFAQDGLAARVEMFRGDITSLEDVMRASRDCVSAVHLAGIMTVDCRKAPLRGARINVMGSLNVFEAALKFGFSQVAYVSTAGVFGTQDPVNPYPETHYGAFKLAIEGSARAYWHDHGLPSVGFRPYIVYGQGVSSGIAAGPSIALLAAHEKREALIQFSGRVGFVYVEDVAEAFVAAIKNDVSGATQYNLTGAQGEMNEFVSELSRQAPHSRTQIEGRPLSIVSDIAPQSLPPYLAALPVTSVSEGIARTLAHYKANRVPLPRAG